MLKGMSVKSVLFVGQAYYNHWYLSQELKKIGWRSALVNIDTSDANKNYYHGDDISFASDYYKKSINKLEFYLEALFLYQNFHFANKGHLYFINDYDFLAGRRRDPIRKILIKLLMRYWVRKDPQRLLSLYKLLGKRISEFLFKLMASAMPYRWDVHLLRYFSKNIIYTNNACHDGVTKSRFSKWATPNNEPICSLCHLYNSDLCNDKEIANWSRFRNTVADYQCLLGSNRAEYNLDKKIHETPWVYCMDRELWSPNLLIPANFILSLPKNAIKIFHAVGNFDNRSKGSKNIKSTHVYLQLIQKLKQKGHAVELVFFNNVPNKELRFYQTQADIFVDMLSYGFFGATVREGLMLGKPCVCYLRPEWLEDMRKEIPDYVAELPVISATEYTIEEVLEELIVNKDLRLSVGQKSREFALKWHASDVAAVEMAKIYSELDERKKQ